ncbi:ATP-binding protein [Pseudidiomarina sp.]|uniref:HAMP domain-containing sensor histidine kinase n=1 Tax=Pseudidiomarina sp. TaxID=2081707 RepID=UPI003A96FFDF
MNLKVSSIKRSVTSLVILITTISVTLACLVLSYNFIADTHHRLLRQSEQVSRFIAENATSYMVYNQAEAAERWLQSLRHSPLIQHVHLYRYDPSTEALGFFASYYAEREAPIPVRFDRVKNITEARFATNYVESAVPLYVQNTLQGYVYLRTSRAALDEAKWYAAAISGVIITASFILSWLMSLWLRRVITQPLDEMVESIQQIARDKNYDRTLHEFELQELDRVSDAFNALLSRIQQHIRRQEQAEREASELNAELELQVKQRTQKLYESNQELHQALETAHQYQSELVQAEKMSSLAKLVSGVAHEVNTPVGLAVTSTSILQDNLQLLKQKFADKKLTSQEFQRYMSGFEENLALISRNIKRTADLISNFSKLSMDQFSDDDRSLHLTKFWDEIAQSLYNRHPELTSVELSCQVADDLIISTRPGPLNQVISQLVQNALQHAFSNTAHPMIRFSFSFIPQAESSESGDLQMTYEDNGDGIPDDLIKSVFDPFVTSKRSHGAAGLGLHLVYNLVVQVLQGHIELESQPHQGTRFKVVFPVRRLVQSK